MPECPYCGAAFKDKPYLYRHAMTDHREAVLAHWIDEHDIEPPLSGQARLGEAVA